MGIVNVTIQIKGKRLRELERGDADNGLIQARIMTTKIRRSRVVRAAQRASNNALSQLGGVAPPSTAPGRLKGHAKKLAVINGKINKTNIKLLQALQQGDPLQRAIFEADKEHGGNRNYSQKQTLIVVSTADEIQWRIVDDKFQTYTDW